MAEPHLLCYLPSTKFQSISKNPEYGTKFPKKDMSDKNFGRINIKIVISI